MITNSEYLGENNDVGHQRNMHFRLTLIKKKVFCKLDNKNFSI